ncbi:MAG: hypothetical protein KGZ64_10305 [Thermaerobacter sp.]|nr:hypothetical protein [Thermaerobacter sp.]
MSTPNAPFFMFFKFHEASTTNKAKNAAHIKYIAERPRVDKRPQEAEDDEIHFRYLNERPRSHGLFTQDAGEPNMASAVQAVKEHDGLVWRAILSLREDDAIKYGYTNRGKWEDTLRATLPDLAHKMGIASTDFRWYAAFHKEAGHPHVHVVFWDRSAQRKRGKLTTPELNYARRLFMREIYGEERRRLLAEKTILRDLTRKEAIDFTKTSWSMDSKDSIVLRNDLLMLSFSLPKKGKMSLAFMPAPVKDEARRIADGILNLPGLREQKIRHEEIAGQLAMHHTLRSEDIAQAKQNATSDMRDRVAQVVIKAASDIRRSRGTTRFMQSLVLSQTWSLLKDAQRHLEDQAFWMDVKAAGRKNREGQEQVEVDKQKEVERA